VAENRLSPLTWHVALTTLQALTRYSVMAKVKGLHIIIGQVGSGPEFHVNYASDRVGSLP